MSAHLKLPGRPPGDESIYNEVFLDKVYEKHYTLKPGDAVVDVGAHVGFFSYKAALVGCSVFAFEPSPDNFEALAINTWALPNVVRVNVGLGSYRHTADLWWAPNNSGGHSLHRDLINHHSKSFVVEIRRLDEMVMGRVDFIKIDAEGAEAEIIKGGYEKISAYRPGMAIEIHSTALGKEVEDLLAPLNYETISKTTSWGGCYMLYAVPR